MESKYLFKNRRYDIQNSILKNKIIDEEPYSVQISNGIVLPYRIDNGIQLGGVIDEQLSFVEESKTKGDFIKAGGAYSIGDRYEYFDFEVIYLGFFLKQWGHFLIDFMSRAWILTRMKGVKVAYLPMFDKKLTGNYLELIKLLGVKEEDIIPITNPTKFKTVIVPTLSIDDNFGYMNAYKETFQYIKSECDFGEVKYRYVNKNIYLSRMRLSNKNKDIGEKSLERIFEKSGWEIVYPEELTATEQICVFSCANSIACVNGSAPLMVMFADKALKLHVFNKTSLIHMNLFRACKMAEVEPIYIDSYYEPYKNHPIFLGVGPFWIDINENVKRYCEDYGLIFTEKKRSLAEYLRYMYEYYYIKTINFLRRIYHKLKI